MTDSRLETAPTASADWAGLKDGWGWMLGMGVVWIALGTFAIFAPFVATLAFELLLGALFAVGGVMQIIQAFRCRQWQGFGLHVLGGVLALVLGVVFLLIPIGGILTLTLLLGAFFVADGTFKTISALRHKTLQNWGWLLFSGLLGIVIGLLLWLGWPGTALWALGILVGVELIFSGWSMVMLALSARNAS